VDILGIKPDKVSSVVGRCRLLVSVCIFLLPILGEGHFTADQVMDIREAFCQTLGLAFFMVVYSDVQFEVNFGIQSIVYKER
jgi:regulator of sigma D